jgi:pimeloyl-ACP methyl ester carboxylesterase
LDRNSGIGQGFLLPPFQGWFEELRKKRQLICEKPTLFIWGIKDPAIKPHHLEKFVFGFPNSSVLKLSSCGHFPQEEEPEEVLRTVRNFKQVSG